MGGPAPVHSASRRILGMSTPLFLPLLVSSCLSFLFHLVLPFFSFASCFRVLANTCTETQLHVLALVRWVVLVQLLPHGDARPRDVPAAGERCRAEGREWLPSYLFPTSSRVLVESRAGALACDVMRSRLGRERWSEESAETRAAVGSRWERAKRGVPGGPQLWHHYDLFCLSPPG